MNSYTGEAKLSGLATAGQASGSFAKRNLWCRLKNCEAFLAEEKRRTERLRQRIEELEADADLGRLVRRMPEGCQLRHCYGGGWASFYGVGCRWVESTTPESVLREVLGEERDEAE